jgi:hypothetical protein
MATSLDDLLLSLAGAPSLPGARCRGRHHLFDPPTRNEDAPVVEARHAQALSLCGRCPALALCRAWVAELPARQRPPGVVAGEIRQPA